MAFYKHLPRLIRWIISTVLLFLIIMTIGRLLFFWQFNPTNKKISGSTFLMGLRFDIKFSFILGAAMMVFSAIPFLNPFKKNTGKIFWNILLPLVFIIVIIFYTLDHYYYDYLHQRLNANILSYAKDASISASMVWQSYPIIKIVIALLIISIIGFTYFPKVLSTFLSQQKNNIKYTWVYYLVFFLFLGMGVFGKFSQYPLRWSDAFTLSDDYKANLALNPIQSFFSSLRFTDAQPNAQKVKQDYALMSSYLGVNNPDSATLNFKRSYNFTDSSSNKPNVVFVLCESFSMYKSSMSGNPLNTTPYFNELCNQGVFFDRCFTPAIGTARGVWALLTGLPDVLGSSKETASRNPAAVNQHLIIDNFKGYDKYYFLGGDPTWANIQGLLKNNIEGLKIYSQDDFNAKKEDVWGVSDKHLFLEANKIIAQNKKPFVAIIQTADNHRPYTIPNEDLKEFNKVSLPQDSLIKYGFGTNDELNAFRYTDYCYQHFIEAARKENYFNNTIFVFVGDHGILGDAKDIYPKSWTNQWLDGEHVPLLFYSPKLLQPKRLHNVCSQIDIFPTAASMIKMPYTNNTLGRNLFDTIYANNQYAFIMNHDMKTIGIVSNQYYFLKNIMSGKEEFVSVTDNNSIIKNTETEKIKNNFRLLTDAYYETAKYLIVNNKKNNNLK